MPNVSYSLSIAGAGSAIQKAVPRTGDSPITLETELEAGKTVTAWVKTDADTADCNLPSGHGYATGVFDVFWTGGRRYGVTGTVTSDALALDGGTGDDFPASATTGVVCCRQVQVNIAIDGDNTGFLAIAMETTDNGSTDRAHITFKDSGSAAIANIDLAANVPQVWDIEGGSANPFTGNPIVTAHVGCEDACTLKILGIQDATP